MSQEDSIAHGLYYYLCESYGFLFHMNKIAFSRIYSSELVYATFHAVLYKYYASLNFPSFEKVRSSKQDSILQTSLESFSK